MPLVEEIKINYIKQFKIKMSLISKLKEIEPNRHLVFTAIDKLKSPDMIRQFYCEYATYLRRFGEPQETRERAPQAALDSIHYALGFGYSKKTKNKWNNSLQSLI